MHMDNELIEVGGRVMRRYLLKYFHTYHYKTHEDDWAEGVPQDYSFAQEL